MKLKLTLLSVSWVLASFCYAGSDEIVTLPDSTQIYQAMEQLHLKTFASKTNIHQKLDSRAMSPETLSTELDTTLEEYITSMGLDPHTPFSKMTMIGRKYEILTSLLTAEDFNLMCSKGFTEHRLD